MDKSSSQMFAASILITMRRKMLCSAYKTPWMRLFYKTCKIDYIRLKSAIALSVKYLTILYLLYKVLWI